MKSMPRIQLALDYVSLPPALAMAQLVNKEIDAIEVGTPLCKAEGMRAVSAIRALCPDKIILADVKAPDVGEVEAKIAFDAGADWMTVLGAAPLPTVELALKEARSRPGKEMFVELTGIRDILARAREWRAIGVERMVYHRGWDEGNTSRTWDSNDRETIQQLIEMGFKISIAGGLELEMIPFFKGLDIQVFIIGRAIREAKDPVASARQFRTLINHCWGSSPSPSNFHQLAAKAVRWAICETGLLLTVDARAYPDHDAYHFNQDPRIEIMVPPGVDGKALVNHISTLLDPADRQAVGWTKPGTFYLELGCLSILNEVTVINLLRFTGIALNTLGYPVDTGRGIDLARKILQEDLSQKG